MHVIVFVTAATYLALAIADRPLEFLHGEYLVWVGLIVLAQSLPVPVWREARLDLSFPLSVAVAVLYDPAVAGLIAFVGSVDPREFRRQVPVLRAVFNRSQIALSTAVVGLVFHTWATVDSPLSVLLPAAIAAALAGYAVNVALVTAAMSLDYGMPPRTVFRHLRVGRASEFIVSYLGFGLLGAVLAHIYHQAGLWSLPLAVGPLLLARQSLYRSRALEEAESKYRTLVEQIPAVMYMGAADGTNGVLYISPQVESMLGFAPDRWIEQNGFWASVLHPEDRERVLAEFARAEAGGSTFSQEYRLIAADGRVVWIRDEARPVGDEGGEVRWWQGVMVDITAAKEAEEQISFLAYHDKLTGLPNRLMFEEVLSLALGRARRRGASVAVLYLDLDNFKLVNDSLGHSAGDELLREVSQRLRNESRETDILARQGGDEFLLVLADIEGGPGEAVTLGKRMANRIQRALRASFDLGGTEVYASASIGISIFPIDAEDAVDLLMHADTAMFRSKKAGPAGALLFGGETSDRLGELSFATRLRQAAENERWTVSYQPIVDLSEGRMVGVEALVRWTDPDLGEVSPARFIPVAEDMGLIGEIDDWVLGEVARQARAWHQDGIDLDVHVNVSLRRLWEPDLVNRVEAMVNLAEIDAGKVVIEITESTAMADPDRTKRVLGELHALGLRVAIDDFGTAHSSLSRLKELDIDMLKIDRPFLHDVPADPQAAGLLSAIVQLSHSLGVQPLAEGVETSEQLDLLVHRGCRWGQGFYLSRPVPPHQIPELFARRLAPPAVPVPIQVVRLTGEAS